jgi:hypothetical protein
MNQACRWGPRSKQYCIELSMKRFGSSDPGTLLLVDESDMTAVVSWSAKQSLAERRIRQQTFIARASQSSS